MTISALSATSLNYMKLLEYTLISLSNLRSGLKSASTLLKQKFIKLFFGKNVNWVDGAYRTDFLHPLIEPKATLLKGNGLLFKEHPVVKLGKKEESTRERN